MTNNTEAPAPLINGRTEAEWAELATTYATSAARCRKSSADSWERSDTDGFLSQWASDSTAREYDSKIAWAEAQGWGETNVLTDLEGNVVSTLCKQGNWGGDYWVLNDEQTARTGKRFLNEPKGKNWAIRAERLAAKGFRLARAIVPTSPPKLHGTNAMALSVWAEPKWDELRAMAAAGTLEFAHTDWLMTLSRRWDEDNAADDVARATPTTTGWDALQAVTEEVDQAREAKVDQAKRASGSHADCSHEATKSARAACRRARNA